MKSASAALDDDPNAPAVRMEDRVLTEWVILLDDTHAGIDWKARCREAPIGRARTCASRQSLAQCSGQRILETGRTDHRAKSAPVQPSKTLLTCNVAGAQS